MAWLLRLRTTDALPLTLVWLTWLPWLPFRVPAVALLWDGPLEGVMWAVALTGVIAARIGAFSPG